jgi:hypothetical protein
MRGLLHRLARGGPRRRRLVRLARDIALAVPVPHLTVRAAWLLRRVGFTVGDATRRGYVARRDCRIDVMRLPPGARAIATGQPVRHARMSLISWACVLLWRLTGRI